MTSQKANPLPRYQKTQTQRALPGFSGAPRQKPVRVNCRPPDYNARDGLHIADGAEPWCGPARRLADPCAARTSGAPSRALFHSPVPGPGHVTRYSAHVPCRPRFFQLHPCRWRPREPVCPASASAGTTTTHFQPNCPPGNHPRPHLPSGSWYSLQEWAARTSPLTARRVVLAPTLCRSSFRGTSSSRATCRTRSPSCSEETFIAPRAQQGEGAARLRATPARARRGRLSMKETPMTGTPPSTWGCRFHVQYIE